MNANHSQDKDNSQEGDEGKMPNPHYATFEVPEELSKATLEAIRIARTSGKVKKGVNESIKSIERGQAKLVAIAKDVDPPEIVVVLPAISDERKIPYVFVPSKRDLGEAAGINVPSAAVTIEEPGEAKSYVEEITKKINEIRSTTLTTLPPGKSETRTK